MQLSEADHHATELLHPSIHAQLSDCDRQSTKSLTPTPSSIDLDLRMLVAFLFSGVRKPGEDVAVHYADVDRNFVP
jgi:hypothetical protein